MIGPRCVQPGAFPCLAGAFRFGPGGATFTIMAITKLGIIQRAATRTGNEAITSLDDGGAVSTLAAEHYEGIVEEYLTQHAWKFARRVEAMSLTALTPEKPWSQVWRKPGGLLSLQYVQDENGQRLDQEERSTAQGACCVVLGVNASLFAVGTFRVDESEFPPDFAMAIQHRMEAINYGGIAEQHDLADKRERMAELKLQKARVRDQRASTAGDASEWDLAVARDRRGAWSNRAYR